MITKVFFDSEFTGLHRDTTLIGLAMVAEDGREFYAEFTDYNRQQVNQWLADNVIAHLILGDLPAGSSRTDGPITLARGNDLFVGNEARKWLEQFDKIEIWGDCLAYDWVLFCDLFGGAMEIPRHIFYIPMDLATRLRCRGLNPDLSRAEFAGRQGVAQHNALEDARTIRACFDKVSRM